MGAEPIQSGDEAPAKPWKYLSLMGVTTITYYLSWWAVVRGPGPMLTSVLKFGFYVSIILWLNSAFYLSKYAAGVEVECFEFQREQVKLTLWIVAVWVLMELPLMLASLSSSSAL